MKLVSLLPLASLASLGLVSAAVVSVSTGSDTTKIYAKLTDADASIRFCPTAACDTVYYTVTPAKIAEFNSDGSTAVTANAVTDFTQTNSAITANAWGEAVPINNAAGTAIGKSYTFKTSLTTSASPAVELGTLELTASIYTVETTETYATKSVKIPAGGVKITAKIPSWAYASSSTSNVLKFDFTVASSVKDTDGTTAKAPTLATAVGTDQISWLTTIGGGMFLNVPEKALSGSTPIAATPTLTTSAPYTLTLKLANSAGAALTYDDAVMYYSDPTTPAPTTAAPTNATNSTTPAPSGASSIWGYAASVFVGAAGIAAMMF